MEIIFSLLEQVFIDPRVWQQCYDMLVFCQAYKPVPKIFSLCCLKRIEQYWFFTREQFYDLKVRTLLEKLKQESCKTCFEFSSSALYRARIFLSWRRGAGGGHLVIF